MRASRIFRNRADDGEGPDVAARGETESANDDDEEELRTVDAFNSGVGGVVVVEGCFGENGLSSEGEELDLGRRKENSASSPLSSVIPIWPLFSAA